MGIRDTIRNRRYNSVSFVRCPCQICRALLAQGDSGISFLKTTKCRKPEIPIFATILAKRRTASKHIPKYADFYTRKYAEVTKHQHKRALALTSRKFVRLVFGLLVKNQLYTGEKAGRRIKYGILITLIFQELILSDGEVRPFLGKPIKIFLNIS